jgi:hypothetical protein
MKSLYQIADIATVKGPAMALAGLYAVNPDY